MQNSTIAVPLRALFDSELSARDLRVLMASVYLEDKTCRDLTHGMEVIAAFINCDFDAVENSVDKLIKHGFFTPHKLGVTV